MNNYKNGASNKKMNFKKGLKIYRNVIDVSMKLEKHYDMFWKNIYYNDAYVYYKNAIEYYKNIQNKKHHSAFSEMINKKLYTGSCQYIEKERRTDFSNNENIKIDLDDLCELSVQTINILDFVLLKCPKIPFNLNVYRTEIRKSNDVFFTLKKVIITGI